ncbi:lipoprotein metalloprotease SslE [Escherichia albertii NBRC 107761 = DSM 17582]|uniref:AcfD n=1 Tax=Escherichia albertii (strain TW07627) TaxID=502347 RepID=A0ABC9NVM0_ESCAT|nr:lipoprotein metalloprotease SslE [Escherichia albertii]EDS94203.1 AcfD [Escherichia albertii TW07627]EKG0289839.1 lipoprotein metalloprotease SslE [Escherichia albertii]MCJ2198283.1 lipoprotein metalloprotease SslE [Escherichia albertii NBRC 107761 = DSM 17582]MCZ8797529.1 lipoprotein metalloprotease SslE [Escherichia albertii]GAL54574.1 putative lipoprotein YghJ [Escherichia albertii NBRC 107761 = DSM 17582]
MNKKFKYKKSLLAAILSATLLAGCDGGGSGSSSDTPPVDSGTGSLPEVKPDPTPNPDPTPEPEPTPDPTPDPEPTPEPEPAPTKTGYLTLGGSQRVTGVTCNGETSDGFTFTPGDTVSCVVGSTTIATFDTQSEAARSLRSVEKVSFSLENAQELAGSDNKKTNAISLVTSSDSCPADAEQLCLTFSSVVDRARFEKLYKQIELTADNFSKLVNEEMENNAATDKAPSTHTSPVVPATTPGTKPDLNASFVSANAEQFYQYQPTEIILSEGRLVDSLGNGVAGVDYYTNSGRGVTGENGKFSFSWGETVSFGIDTFELGSVRGNKSTIALTELGDEVRGANIDQLIHRYSQAGKNGDRELPDVVRKVFAEYPNVINEIINLSLSNGETLNEGDKPVELPNEFIKQFESGQAKEIDTAICDKTNNCNSARWFSLTTRNVNDGQIQGVINKLWGVDTNYQSVSKFHVFHDSTNFYGSTGSARGQAVVNISNAAFPILMARNDKNYWLAFGEKRAWDKNELAYITEAPSIVEPENVTRDTATFNLPFISLGQVGEGKLMVIGNPYYNSILRCPNGYSWEGGVDKNGQCTRNSDSDDMKHFMQNVLRYLSNDIWQPNTKSTMAVGTNLENVYFKRHGQVTGSSAPFGFHPDFAGISVKHLSSYGDLNPEAIPLLILNGFEYVTQVGNDPYAIPLSADTSKPKLTQQDVTDLIAYMNKGGSVLIMENVMSNLKEESASGFVRLLDAAGLSMALNKSVVNTDPQGYPNRVRQQRATDIWVYERYPAVDGKPPYTIDEKTKEVIWKYQQENKPDDKPKLEVASWLEDVNGKQETRYAFIDEAEHKTKESLEAAKAKILEKFPGLQECTDSTYHYEINCLERRPGTKVPVTGGMYVPQYTQLSLNADTAKAMVQAADLGTNIQRLYQHELYFRTNGRKGERLNSVDLERLYQNMSVWLWNETEYRYENDKDDELGFKTFTEFLNCYANNAYKGGTQCSTELKQSLVDNNMIYGEKSGNKAGMMNPSYPLNYMEKPLTRLMLGRSWWDLNIKVDVAKYPGDVSASGETVTETISLYSNPTKWFAGNMQSTGLWAPAQQDVSIQSTAKVPVTVTVALADDLTGREKHEVALNRPPRVTKTYTLAANGTVTFKVPYGGLIYIKGDSKEVQSAEFTFTGVVKAPFYKDGQWKHELSSPAPLGELESESFVYTTPKNNLNASNYTGGLEQFAKDLDTFASSMNDFYGRNDESGSHRMFTYEALKGHKHRFTNDVQISIGDAHSGYPVMNSSFSPNSTTLPTTPLNDWLIWHEVGHNAAETPLTVPGATEVANNVLALYMQDRYLGKMNRVADDITVAPEYLEESKGQAWARGGAGDRLLMYAQLKEWAEKNFDIRKWYPEGTTLPAFYSEREGMKGWNLFQLMHRKARGDEVGKNQFGDKNYCAESNGNAADTLMLCASWVAQADLSEFFKKWNPGASAYQLPGATEMSFQGGVSQSAYSTLAGLKLPKPQQGPETINKVTEHAMSAE